MYFCSLPGYAFIPLKIVCLVHQNQNLKFYVIAATESKNNELLEYKTSNRSSTPDHLTKCESTLLIVSSATDPSTTTSFSFFIFHLLSQLLFFPSNTISSSTALSATF